MRVRKPRDDKDLPVGSAGVEHQACHRAVVWALTAWIHDDPNIHNSLFSVTPQFVHLCTIQSRFNTIYGWHTLTPYLSRLWNANVPQFFLLFSHHGKASSILCVKDPQCNKPGFSSEKASARQQQQCSSNWWWIRQWCTSLSTSWAQMEQACRHWRRCWRWRCCFQHR